MQHDLIEAGVGASPVSRPELVALAGEIAGEKNMPRAPSSRPDTVAPLGRILGANELL
jgi:hypothetical protein